MSKTQYSEAERKIHQTSAREALVMIVMALIIGLASGLVAVSLLMAVHSAINWSIGMHQTIYMVIVPAVGAALASILINNILKDNLGHGVPELIRSVNVGGGRLRADLVYSRLVSSLLTVGSGGSAGLEAPIATTGGALGSFIATYMGRFIHITELRQHQFVGYGVAGAVAGIFNAPLTGTIFVLEIILREWRPLTILPTAIAAVSATEINRLIMGNQTAFTHLPLTVTTWDLLAAIPLGIAAGFLSVWFQRGLRRAEYSYTKLKLAPWITAGLGGLMVGGMGYFFPLILHDGYNVIQYFLLSGADASSSIGRFFAGLDGGYLAGGVFLFVLLKFVSSCMTLGSGGSGGVFAPCLSLGCGMGYGYGLLLDNFLSTVKFIGPTGFALVGMTGLVAGVMHAPLTGLFLVMEITQGYSLILPLMIVTVFSMLIAYYFEEGSVYTRELIDKRILARRGSDLFLLRTIEPSELLDKEDIVLYEDMLLGDFIEEFKRAHRNIFPVVERETRKWRGIVYLDEIRQYMFDNLMYKVMTMGEVMDVDVPVVDIKETTESIVEKFEESGAWSLPVTEQGRFIGMLSKSTLFDRYRQEMLVQND